MSTVSSFTNFPPQDFSSLCCVTLHGDAQKYHNSQFFPQGNFKGKVFHRTHFGKHCSGDCPSKVGPDTRHPGQETVTLLREQICELWTEYNRDGTHPFSRYDTGLPGLQPRGLSSCPIPVFRPCNSQEP